MPEAIPFALEALVLLAAMTGFLVASGLLSVWGHSIGYLLEWIASVMPGPVTIFGRTAFPDIAGIFRRADSAVVTALQAWRDGAEIEVAWSIHKMSQTYEWTAEAIDYLTRETAQTFDWLTGIKLPKWAKWAVPAAVPLVLLKRLVAHAVAVELPKIIRVTHVVEHSVTTRIVRVTKYAAAVAGAGVLGLPGIRAEVRTLNRRWERFQARLRKLELLLGATAFAAAMANVLGIPSARCLRSGNIGKVARRLCGLGPAALNDLLGLIADVLILQNICTVLVLLEDGLSLIEGPLNDFVSAVEAFACYGQDYAPPRMTLPALHLPPVTGVRLHLV